VVDSIKAQYLQKLYGTYAPVSYVIDENEVIEYANCLAKYGAIIAQAGLNLHNNLKRFGRVLKGKIKGDSELERFKQVVRGALLEATNTKKFAPPIQNILRTKIEGPCKFAGSHGSIICGAHLLKLQPPQQLLMQNFTLFGEHPFGIGGYTRISKSAGSERTVFEYVPIKN
jgi:hypothetical protein